MRVANQKGRLVVATDGEFVDVALASDGRFGPDPQAVYDSWPHFSEWVAGARFGVGEAIAPAELGPPVPRPRQVFAVALNYPEHAAEGGFTPPEYPLVFTKFPTCLAGLTVG
jgi:2-keto-4-pentenoate hydratase/2-oxohepta-3-ene-1,7-dioic acid hydratase in catechol pathway